MGWGALGFQSAVAGFGAAETAVVGPLDGLAVDAVELAAEPEGDVVGTEAVLTSCSLRAIVGPVVGPLVGAVVGAARGALATVPAVPIETLGAVGAEADGCAVAVLLAWGAEPPQAPTRMASASTARLTRTRIAR